jgi:hypothetical protein
MDVDQKGQAGPTINLLDGLCIYAIQFITMVPGTLKE